ncbi:hypothetical protein [Alcaligenes faecalis]|uniref:hypothetical protein n=1 Tax=Alcaligenes faecalis TaxID=511 RepID=UPI0013DE5267|nr:hypothetical protein [Alcaligenes faecalis]
MAVTESFNAGGTIAMALNPDPNINSWMAVFLVKAASGELTGQSKGKQHQVPSVGPQG